MTTGPGAFLERFARLPRGYTEGLYAGRRYGVIVTTSAGGRQHWLYAEELGGSDRISFNLYDLRSGPKLKPCEMPAEKVVRFVLDYAPDERTS
ncbi:hypothetical protein [Parvularcula dongshanensis]|uniref:Peptide methionine sulfoxide reductase n=1 Tax=Parvularcula dongshanensis TaxID=1173995 RepID=A0A840I659_9PROT|nr:hypothetical protein [Parvularcula dongshanensis]MBB4659500.1 hypothetical protein [Parvularcula dongshanensis]